MADKRGHLRYRDGEGKYSTFYPVTKSDSVIVGENNESLKDHVTAVTDKLGDIKTSLSELNGVPQKLTSLESRLDSNTSVDTIINPGLQVIDVPKDAPLVLSGMKGRTLINLLGRRGAFETVSDWVAYGGSMSVDGSKLTILGSGSSSIPQISNTQIGPAPNPGDVYFLRANVTVTSDTSKLGYVSLYLYNRTTKVRHGAVQVLKPATNKTSYLYSKLVIPAEQLVGDWSNVAFIVSASASDAEAANGLNVIVSETALFKVSSADKQLTADELNVKYPFVNSIKPVQNPYAIRHGENLFPPLYEARLISYTGHHIVKPYEAVLEASASNQGWFLRLPCLPNQDYTFNATHNGAITLSTVDKDGKTLKVNYHSKNEVHFTSESNAVFIDISLGNANKGPGHFTFKNPMLNLGSVGKPFEPREDTIFALQAELHSDPHTGEDSEELFELNGQYLQTKRWYTVTLDENLDWKLGSPKTGFKEIYVPGLTARAEKGVGYGVKYNGDVLVNLTPGVQTSAGDQMMINTDNSLILTVSGADSGWSDTYAPTAEEIRAYLLGWVMYTGASPGPDTLYNGTGSKLWTYRNGNTWAGGVDVIPTTKAPNWEYYKLTYKLKTPSAVPVTSEGRILLHEGKNQIEVGTGIVLRESTKVYTEYSTEVDARCNINNASWGTESTLKNKAGSILKVYRGNEHDPRWIFTNSNVTSAGALAQLIYASTEDIIAAYSTTYIMSEKSAVSSFIGSYSTTEKGILTDVTDMIHRQAAVISMLENKKSDTDIQTWIAPTLVNGWTKYHQTPAFMKLDNGLVMLKGRMSSGVITSGTQLFTLPVGYRPDESRRCVVGIHAGTGSAQTTTGTINISPSGQVTVDQFPGNAWVSLDGIIFRTYEN